MTTAERVLTYARAELGKTETPANSNRTPYGKWYGLDGQPWCMMFVMWVLHQAGVKIPHKTASCSDLLRWYQANRPACVVKVPEPGDIVLYTFGHTGFVETAGPGTITAIEGNTSPDSGGSQANGGMVCRKTRKQSLVKAYVRPEYELEEEMMDISKLTDAEVLQLARRMQKVLAAQPVSSALASELEQAKAAGITSGADPNAFATRIQTAAMVFRAMNAMKPQ